MRVLTNYPQIGLVSSLSTGGPTSFLTSTPLDFDRRQYLTEINAVVNDSCRTSREIASQDFQVLVDIVNFVSKWSDDELKQNFLSPIVEAVKNRIVSFAKETEKLVPKYLIDLLKIVNPGIGYDANDYADGKSGVEALPFRYDVEAYTIQQLIGSIGGVAGKRIVDLGCGDGIYARKLVEQGAEQVLGIDLDPDFITKGVEANTGYETKVSYQLEDIQNPAAHGKNDADIVLGSYVMSYPKNYAELVAYAKTVASHLKPGAKFVGFGNNAFEVCKKAKYHKYGCVKRQDSDVDGSIITGEVKGLKEPIITHYFKPETYQKAFAEVGLDLEWRPVQVDPNTMQSPGYWNELIGADLPGDGIKGQFAAMLATKI